MYDQPVCLSSTVDTAGAGEGTLAVDITRNGRSIPSNVTSEGRGMYRINFTPDGSGIYSIKVLFAGMEVPGEQPLTN